MGNYIEGIKKLEQVNIEYVVIDFDGTLTDGCVYVWEDGSECVKCNRSDGIGLGRLWEVGIEPIILSSEENPVVQERAEKLGVKCYSGITKKRKWLEKRKIKGVYIGNDINDIGAMEYMDFSVAVADAYPEVKEVADFITVKKGGDGAVREVCDLIYNIKKEADEEEKD